MSAVECVKCRDHGHEEKHSDHWPPRPAEAVTGPVEEEHATCQHCARAIVWHFDLDEDDQPTDRYGFWYDVEHMTEVCGGPDPAVAVDEDLWHGPEGWDS